MDFFLKLFLAIIGFISICLNIYFIFIKKGKLRINYEPNIESKKIIKLRETFKGKIILVNTGNIDLSIYSIFLKNNYGGVLQPIKLYHLEKNKDVRYETSLILNLPKGKNATIEYEYGTKKRLFTIRTGFVIQSSIKPKENDFTLIWEG